MQKKAEICQNRTDRKDEFFRGTSIDQIKKWSTNESQITTWAGAQKISKIPRVLAERTKVFGEAQKSGQKTASCTFFQIEVILGTKTK